MKYLLAILLITLTSFAPINTAYDFHVKIVGKEKVEQFESRFPYIVNDEAVYVAYLQQYYKGHEDDFINLIK